MTGMRVEPPTMTTSTSRTSSFASARAFLERLHAALRQVGGQLFELGPRQRDVEVLGAVLIGRDERED